MLPLSLCFTFVVLLYSYGPVKCLFYFPDSFTSESDASRFNCSFLCISSSYKIFLTSWEIQMHAYDVYHDVSSTLVLMPRLHKTPQSCFIFKLSMSTSPSQIMTGMTPAQFMNICSMLQVPLP